MAAGIRLAPLFTEIRVRVENFRNDMERAAVVGREQAERISAQMSKVAKAGETLEKAGSKMTKAVSLPLIGAGVAVTKMAVDFDGSFAKVSTLLTEGVVDFTAYKDELLAASNETKIAVDEFSESVYSSISAGVDQTKAIAFTTDAMKLAKGGFTDGAKAVDVLTTAINGYGLAAEDASRISDLLITTQNLGKTTVDELASSMGAVIPIASSVNFNIEELSASYAQLTKNGIATSETGTYMKSMLSELGKAGSIADKTLRELTGKGFADLKKEGMATTEILQLLSDTAEKDDKTLKDMFGSVEAGSAALVLMKGDGEEYNEMLNAMGNSAGATQSAFEKMDATPAERMAGAVNKLKNAGIQLGESLVPVFEKAADVISNLAEKFSDMTDEQKENILKWGAIAIAAGPVISVFGKVLTVGSKIAPLLGGISAAAGATSAAGGTIGLTAALGGVVGAAAPAVLAIGAVGAAGYGLYKTMSSEVVPAVDLFANEVEYSANEITGMMEVTTTKISEETQTQIQSFMDLAQSAQQETMNMYAGVTQATDEGVASIAGKVEQMSSNIIQATADQRTQVISNFQEMFQNSSVVTSEEQGEILRIVNEKYAERIQKTTELKDELLRIYEDIKNNSGQATQDQQERIDQIYDEMRRQAVESMAQSEAEQSVILNRLSASNQRVTAEMVGNTIQELNRQRDESIQAAAESRDEQVRQAELLKAELGEDYAETADKIIEEANRQYDEVVKTAEGIRNDGVSKVMDAHEDMKNKVNQETGEIMTLWDKLKNWWDGLTFSPKETTITTREVTIPSRRSGKSHYNGLEYVPYDGYQATLHKGERVLTAKENQGYSEKWKPVNVTIPLVLDGREMARASAELFGEQMVWEGL